VGTAMSSTIPIQLAIELNLNGTAHEKVQLIFFLVYEISFKIVSGISRLKNNNELLECAFS
jgi:hypothetical protein